MRDSMEDHTAGPTSGAVGAEIVSGDAHEISPRDTTPSSGGCRGTSEARLLNRVLHRSRRPPGAMLSLMTRSYRYSKPLWTCLASRRR